MPNHAYRWLGRSDERMNQRLGWVNGSMGQCRVLVQKPLAVRQWQFAVETNTVDLGSKPWIGVIVWNLSDVFIHIYAYLCHVIPRNLIWKKLYVFFACHGCACDVVLGSRLVLHNRQSDSINVPVIFIDVWIHTLTTNRSVIWEHLKSFRKILEMARSERSKLTILGWT